MSYFQTMYGSDDVNTQFNDIDAHFGELVLRAIRDVDCPMLTTTGERDAVKKALIKALDDWAEPKVTKMIVKCRENGGVGDCPFLKSCLARMNDPTISGCSMPFVWTGMMKISDAVVEHTVSTEKEEPPRLGKRKERKIKRNGK